MTASVPPGETGRWTCAWRSCHHRIALTITNDAGQSVFRGTSMLRVGLLEDASYGSWLANEGGVTAWWCERLEGGTIRCAGSGAEAAGNRDRGGPNEFEPCNWCCGRIADDPARNPRRDAARRAR